MFLITERREKNDLTLLGQAQEEIRWPARPGEEQYEWEEPRVLVDSKESRLQGCGESHTEVGGECEKDGTEVFCGSSDSSPHEGVSKSKESTMHEAQSELGGAVDGLTHRVDRLRLWERSRPTNRRISVEITLEEDQWVIF